MAVWDFIPKMFRKPDEGIVMSPLSKEHAERRRLFALYDDYYRGRHRKNLKVKPFQADDNVTINLAKKIVNSSVSMLVGKGVTFEIDGKDGERGKAEKYLDWIYADDPETGFVFQVWLQSIAINGSTYGNPFVRLFPAQEKNKKPRLQIVDPSIVDVVTNPDDVDDILEYHLVWKSDETWKRIRFVAGTDDNDITINEWRTIEEEHVRDNEWSETASEDWPYDFAPLFHCQNLITPNVFWAASDLEDENLNDVINFVASNTNRIIRIHAHPRTVVTGASVGEADKSASVDNLWSWQNSDAKVFNLEMESDLVSSREHRQDLQDSLMEISATANLEPAKVSLGAMSGFALRLLYGPALAKNDVKRGTYGGMLAKINRALLILGGYKERVVRNVWPDPLPTNGKERAEIAQILSNAGAGIKAAAITAGYTRDEAEDLSGDEVMPPL